MSQLMKCGLSISFFSLVAVLPATATDVTVEQDGQGVTVKIDGQLFTRYLVASGPKPILFPVIGPSGKSMTRGYPMQPAGPHERDDHVHHRSFWFTHGDVNGIDFWSETPNHGTIRHREFLKVEGGDSAKIVTVNDWLGPDGAKVCEDERSFVFGVNSHGRYVDCDIVVRASDGPVTFGDTKEGSFGVRVAGTMKVTAEMGGTILNSKGQKDSAAWGQRATWVDYSGPIDGETVGVAIFNHPASFRHPTYWHVRTYGLFTANPFGWHHFQGTNDVDGSHRMSKGDSFTLRYRVLFHSGDAHQAGIADAYTEYAKK